MKRKKTVTQWLGVVTLMLGMMVSRPFPSWNRSILTEISLRHACSCQEMLRTETAAQVIGADKLTLGDKAWSSMVTTHRD
eukprot:SAG25_NODE_2044_length_2002_cov_2.596427_2_plen_80_part_00